MGLQQANFDNFVSMRKNTPKIAAPPLGGVLISGTPLYGGATRQVIFCSVVKMEKKVGLQQADHFSLCEC